MSVPALRFKEFSGDWITRSLSSILGKLESGVSVNSEDIPANGLDEYGILKTSCIVNGYFIEQENKKIISEDIARAKLNPSEDTILVSRMNTPQLVGEVGYVSKDYPNLFVPDRLWLIEVKNKHRDSTKYLSHQLASKKTKNILTNIASGTSGSMKNISQPSFLKIELNTPEFKEQTKIANFLTAVDEKISLLTQKADLLSQYKKGVMQQIFSQELRFRDDD
ncbi:MAG: restriction endonuclease subunit S, partial [Methylococcales bacterium]|nr:restriction endonuclease subunit S [Methylococcales bacterium]